MSDVYHYHIKYCDKIFHKFIKFFKYNFANILKPTFMHFVQPKYELVQISIHYLNPLNPFRVVLLVCTIRELLKIWSIPI